MVCNGLIPYTSSTPESFATWPVIAFVADSNVTDAGNARLRQLCG